MGSLAGKMGTNYFNLWRVGEGEILGVFFFPNTGRIDISSRYLPVSSQCSRDTPNILVSVDES